MESRHEKQIVGRPRFWTGSVKIKDCQRKEQDGGIQNKGLSWRPILQDVEESHAKRKLKAVPDHVIFVVLVHSNNNFRLHSSADECTKL